MKDSEKLEEYWNEIMEELQLYGVDPSSKLYQFTVAQIENSSKLFQNPLLRRMILNES